MNEDVRALKDALENLNARKSTSRRILKGNFVENFLIGKTSFNPYINYDVPIAKENKSEQY